jgi:DNA primase catalytic subunit
METGMGINREVGLVRRFYASILFNPELPSDTQHRHYRFKTKNGSWVKVKRRIRTVSELKEQILKLDAVDVYYSVSTWLNPDKLMGQKEEDITKVILLRNDLIFDIDCDDPYCVETLNLARKSANNVYEAMKLHKTRYDLEYVAWTGSSGFRLAYKDLKPISCENPRERIALVKEDRKLFIDELLINIEELKKQGKAFKIQTRIDKEVTHNPFSVVRVLGTAHSKTGYLSQRIPVLLLKKDIVYILNKIVNVYETRPGIPSIREMTIDKDKQDLSPRPSPISVKKEDVSGLASSPYFISNKVINTGCYVPVLIYQKQKKNVEKELLRLQEEYGLGTLYLMLHKNDLVVLSLKLFQQRQLMKMLNKTTSRTKHAFKKYAECFFNLDVNLIKTLPGAVKGQTSKPHRIFLNTKFNKKLPVVLNESTGSKIKISKGAGERIGKGL